MSTKQLLVINQSIESKIYSIRGKRVMLDFDIASLYSVETKRLKEQVRRNKERFPEDFMFTLSKSEFKGLRSQNATSKRGGRRYLPIAFTEQGVAMLSSVLKSRKAVKVNIEIMRAFIRMRQLISTHQNIKKKVEALEKKYDEKFAIIFYAIKRLEFEEYERNKGLIGFKTKRGKKKKSKEVRSKGLFY